MEIDSFEHGVPSWVDLGTPDIGAAAEFYSSLFGWTVDDEGPPDAGGYRMCTLRGRAVAGLGPQMNPGPPFWTTYVAVDDVDKTTAAVAEAGGQTLMEPMDVLDAGRMAVFADPSGAAFSVWQARAHAGAGIVNEPGTLSWNELLTTDVEGSKTFYQAVFGWSATTHEGEMPYTEFKLSDRSIAGMMLKPPMMPAEIPPHWGVYFAVEDTDATVAKVIELGGQVLMPATDIEPGRFATVCDPAGAAFNVIAMAEEMS
ncbi:MAG: VOC family protein [Actinomycetia bacterium]|nr:VOC family protein [Actinomycetes bacterium]MCP4226638.1 VOC family protein [Actinomycetes bacterium]MCP5033887.1 VOC family protein [Actinomycetes bacterium]